MVSLWFVSRGAGVVLVAVMTLATALGVLSTARAGSARWPRFATQTLHRNVSLLSAVLILLHAGTAIMDGFVDLRWYHVFAPIGGEYVVTERLPLMLSAIAFDCIVVIVVTSLLRARLPHRFWRGVHLLTYLSWGLGVLHGFLIGTDARTWWGLGVTLASLGVVAVAVVIRLTTLAHERRLAAATGDLAGLR
jgi:sulfoxide reductase heme-binding subunit YedZ